MVLRQIVLLLALVSTSLSYEYHDYVVEDSYHGPALVNDSLLDKCRFLGVQEIVCNTTESGNLTKDQGRQLILDTLNPSLSGLDYNFVMNWNNNKTFSKYPPKGVPVRSSGSIKDAWVKIVSLHPSIRYGNQTLLNQTGLIRSEFAFTFVLPEEPAPGDCKTRYSAKGFNYTLNTTLKGTQINKDDSKIAFYNLTNSSNLFQSNLSIESGYTASHYVWVTHCDDDGDCHETCEYAYTENITDQLNLSDSTVGILYNFTYNATSFVDKNFSGLMDYWLIYNVSENYGQMLFKSGHSYIFTKSVDYRLKSAYAPYNILFYEIVGHNNRTYLQDASLFYDNQTLNGTNITRKLNAILAYSDDCSLTFASHFNIYTIPKLCNITNETPVLNLSIENRTNESISLLAHFYDNQTGVPFVDKDITIHYGSSEQTVRTDSQGNGRLNMPLIGNRVVMAEFITDLKNKSAESFLFIPEEVPEPDGNFWTAIIALLSFSTLYKLSTRSITNGIA